jgi:hypothetical protein
LIAQVEWLRWRFSRPVRSFGLQFHWRSQYLPMPGPHDADRFPDERTADRFPDERTADRFPDERTADRFPDESTSDRFPDESTSDRFPDESTSETDERTARVMFYIYSMR